MTTKGSAGSATAFKDDVALAGVGTYYIRLLVLFKCLVTVWWAGQVA